jgi:hypothetical protein
MRLILLLILLSTFVITTEGRSILDPIGGATADSGPAIDPNGGKPRLSRHANSDQGPTVDPNGGGVHTSAVNGDKGLGVDPNG